MSELSMETSPMPETTPPIETTEFERELRIRLVEAETAAAEAEASDEHDLAEAMRAHADDLRRTAVLHAVPDPLQAPA
jgi:hypothetical protein